MIIFALCAVASLACICLAGYLLLRDRALRGIRIENGQIRREQITLALPNDWMRNFYERDGT